MFARHTFAALIIGVACAAYIPTYAAAPNRFIQHSYAIPNEYIIVAALPDNSEAGRASAVADILAEVNTRGGSMIQTWSHALVGVHVLLDEPAAVAVSALPFVKYVEENSRSLRAATTQLNPDWALDRIDQRALPLDTTYTYFPTGLLVNAYIIDSGIRASHNEFTGRIGNGVDEINDGHGTDDCFGHGTGVA